MLRINLIPKKIAVIDMFFFSIPLFSLFMIEFATRGSPISTILWPIKEPIPFLVSLALFYSLYIIFWVGFNQMGVASVYYSLNWIIISAVAGCKREIIGMPLMPWDVMISLKVAEFMGNINLLQMKFLFNWVFIMILMIVIAMIVVIFALENAKRVSIRKRVISFTICSIIVAAIVLTLPKASLEEAPAAICERNGWVRGFIASAQLWTEMDKVSAAATPKRDCKYSFTAAHATNGGIYPNVIFIMSEAFWDDTLLPDVTYSEDPIPNFRALTKECINGEFVSPTYGGLTCNVEFEVMTGFSLKYLPYQTNAYITSVKKTIPALPSYFKSLGYQTIAVHPNTGTFFNRSEIYPRLGIDRFVTLENMSDAKKKGEYISDDTFADYIISEYQQAKKPVFMFNISVQNHWPYTTKNYYQDNDFIIKTKNNLDQVSMTALQNYTQGIHDADKSLKKMIDYFKTVKEPTVIIFFGDHLPALTEGLGVYKKLGYVQDESISDKDLFHGDQGTEILNQNMFLQNQKILKTPYLIWFNYKTGMEKGKTLSANYFGVYTMSKIGLELPPFYNFLLDYSNKVPVNRHFLSIVEQGVPYKNTPSVYDDYEYTYNRIQNNMLFGDQQEKDLFSIK